MMPYDRARIPVQLTGPADFWHPQFPRPVPREGRPLSITGTCLDALMMVRRRYRTLSVHRVT
jgi:hypothetical protein